MLITNKEILLNKLRDLSRLYEMNNKSEDYIELFTNYIHDIIKNYFEDIYEVIDKKVLSLKKEYGSVTIEAVGERLFFEVDFIDFDSFEIKKTSGKLLFLQIGTINLENLTIYYHEEGSYEKFTRYSIYRIIEEFLGDILNNPIIYDK